MPLDTPDWTRTSVQVDNPRQVIHTTATGPAYESPFIDVSAAQSLIVQMVATGYTYATPFILTVQWYVGSFMTYVDNITEWQANLSGDIGPQSHAVTLPIRGTSCTITLQAETSIGTIDLTVLTSQRAVDSVKLFNGGDQYFPLLVNSGNLTLAAGASQQYYCGPVPNGLLVRHNSSGTDAHMYIFVMDMTLSGFSTDLAATEVNITGTPTVIQVPLPVAAVRLDVFNSSTASQTVDLQVWAMP